MFEQPDVEKKEEEEELIDSPKKKEKNPQRNVQFGMAQYDIETMGPIQYGKNIFFHFYGSLYHKIYFKTFQFLTNCIKSASINSFYIGNVGTWLQQVVSQVRPEGLPPVEGEKGYGTSSFNSQSNAKGKSITYSSNVFYSYDIIITNTSLSIIFHVFY